MEMNTGIRGSNEDRFRLLLTGDTGENRLVLQSIQFQWHELNDFISNTEEKIKELEKKVKNIEVAFLNTTMKTAQNDIGNHSGVLETESKREEEQQPRDLPEGFVVSIVMPNYRSLVMKSKDWKSKTFYPHDRGYNICLGAKAKHSVTSGGPVLLLSLYAVPGKYDNELLWPVVCNFAVNIVNKRGGEDVSFITGSNEWKRPQEAYVPLQFERQTSDRPHDYVIVDCRKLVDCVDNDSLDFCVRKWLSDDVKRLAADSHGHPTPIDDYHPFPADKHQPAEQNHPDFFTTESSIKVTHLYGPTVSLLMVYDRKNFDDQIDWKSLPFFTHPRGYKMRLGVRSNRMGRRRQKVLLLDVYAVPGEYDKELKWPAHYSFQVEIVDNTKGMSGLELLSGHNIWKCPEEDVPLIFADYDEDRVMAKHSTVKHLVKNGILEFKITSDPD